MKSVDEKIIFTNIYNVCNNYMMSYLYLVHILIYNMDIYKTLNFTKCFEFRMIFIIVRYFPFVTCVL